MQSWNYIDCVHLLMEIDKHKIYLASKELSIAPPPPKKKVPNDGSAWVAFLDSEQ